MSDIALNRLREQEGKYYYEYQNASNAANELTREFADDLQRLGMVFLIAIEYGIPFDDLEDREALNLPDRSEVGDEKWRNLLEFMDQLNQNLRQRRDDQERSILNGLRVQANNDLIPNHGGTVFKAMRVVLAPKPELISGTHILH